MGVNGLWKLIDSSGKSIPLEALENRVLAVDVSIWLYQLVKGFQDSSANSGASTYLIGLFHRICKLLFYRIKPIFVFDGGVPVLKRRTIADRQNTRNKANRLGEKFRQSLLENLAKREALGQVLGESVVLPKLLQNKEDTLFLLPPLPEEVDCKSCDSEGVSSSDSEGENDKFRYKDIHSIDITSDEFLSLPADMRHDILTELKETRKQNSWGKLHLIPKEGNDFSAYQMARLLKRRAVQVGIEEAEGEMGTRGFTISDLQTILSDQGIELAQRISADTSTRFLYSNKMKEIIKDKAVEPSTSTKKKPKLMDEINYSSDMEDDPDEFIMSEESDPEGRESLTQSEILELIKHERGDLQPARVPEESEIVETEKGVELGINREAVEKEAGDNGGKLEHGSLPREQSSLHPQLSSQPGCSGNHKSLSSSNPTFHPGGRTQTSPGNAAAPQTNKGISLDEEQTKKRLEVLSYLTKVKEEILSPLKAPILSSGNPISRNISVEIPTFENLPSPVRIILNKSSEESDDDFIEVNNPKDCKINENLSSPIDINSINVNTKLNQLSDVREDEKSSSPVLDTVNNIGSSSNDDFIEVNNPKDCKTNENLSNPIDNNSINVNTKSNQLSDVHEDEKSSSPVVDIVNDISSSSDDDFIEVNDEIEEMDVDESEKMNSESKEKLLVDIPKETKPPPHLEIVIDTVNTLEDDLFADVFENSSKEVKAITSKIVDSKEVKDISSNIDEVKDTCSKAVEYSSVANVKGTLERTRRESAEEKSEAVLGGGADRVTAPSTSQLATSAPSSSQLVTSAPSSSQLVTSAPSSSHFATPAPPSPRPQLTFEEIMKMKESLEKESSVLMMETRREDRTASTITEQIRLDAQELLELFGVPYLIAPMEAEAQCAYLDLTGQTQGTITDDSDIWLFGGRKVYKNFFDQKKFVQEFKSTDIKKVLHLEREEMIMLALLTGSDYTLGLSGVGAVTALEVVAQFPRTEALPTPSQRLTRFAREFSEEKLTTNIAKKLKKTSISEGFPSSEVINAYLDPDVDTSEEKFTWSKPNITELRRYARDKFGWDKTRTDRILAPVLENLCKSQSQGTLHSYFDWKFDGMVHQRSRRVENALNIMKYSLLGEPGPSRELIQTKGRPIVAREINHEAAPPVKSKTPAQIAREKAAKKFKELKKEGKLGPKTKKK